MKPSIEIKDINLGGLADSKYQGIANSQYEIVGLDIHSEPGVIKANQRLIKVSGSTVDDSVGAIVACSDGNAYFFGKTAGKIWKCTSAGVWSLEATAAPAVGAAGILDARELDGYIYYAMQSRLGRWQVGTAWSTRNDSWATFTKTDASYHPMVEANLVLYIGDANQIAQVDGGVFNANVLALAAPYRVRALGLMTNEVVIGTYISDNVNEVKVFRWNTWSAQTTSHDDCPEVGINAFLPTDNYVLAQAGTKGAFYTYDGSQMQQTRRLPGDWSSTNKATVMANAVANYRDLTMFGLSNVSGNPCLQGVYSYGGYANNYPKVLALEYVISTGHTSNIEISAIKAIGDLLFVAWKDLNSGTTYGVDAIDTANKYSGGYFTSRVIAIDRISKKDFTLAAAYRLLPASTDITIAAALNGGSFSTVTTQDDVDRHVKEFTVNAVDCVTAQFRVTFTTSGNYSPELESLLILQNA